MIGNMSGIRRKRAGDEGGIWGPDEICGMEVLGGMGKWGWGIGDDTGEEVG